MESEQKQKWLTVLKDDTVGTGSDMVEDINFSPLQDIRFCDLRI